MSRRKMKKKLVWLQDFDRGSIIYTDGCIPAGEMWFEKNLIPVASVAVAIAVLQVKIVLSVLSVWL